jgi:hypothetical protein
MGSSAEYKRLKESTTELMRVAGHDDYRDGYLEELIARGDDVNARDYYGRTPLILAATNGLPDHVRILLNAGADPTARDNGGWTALDHATHVLGHRDLPSETADNMREVSALLVQAGLRLEDAWRGRAMVAAGADDVAELSRILGEHPDILNTPCPGVGTLLMAAAGFGALGTLGLLLDAGADVNFRNDMTALYRAAQRGQLDACRTLVEAGADVLLSRDEDYPRDTPRSYAAEEAYVRGGPYMAVAEYLAEQERLSKRPSTFAKAKGLSNIEAYGQYIVVKADAAAVVAALAKVAGLPVHRPNVLNGRKFPVGGRGYLVIQFKGPAWTNVLPMTMATFGDPWAEYARDLAAELRTTVFDYRSFEDEGSRFALYESGAPAEEMSCVGEPLKDGRVRKHAHRALKAAGAYAFTIPTCRWPSLVETDLVLPDVTRRDVVACDWVSDEAVPPGRFNLPINEV